ncbi:MAG: LacI family DNA-binding transcriptional regulator [Rhodothermia bacterium]|nr:MAG: LacI family DNA-binding transcriptional regulator [Rhodothermia bacterium]
MATVSAESKRSTIKDVAAEASVAISTVSLVMNGKGYVSMDKRERVLKAARLLKYVPRQAARKLPMQSTGNIGFVLRVDHFARSEPFYTRIFLGTEFEAHNHKLYVLLTTIPKKFDPTLHTPRFLDERNIDGLLVAGKVDPAFVSTVARAGIPLVLIDFQLDDHPAVVIDNLQGARMAVEHLFSRGHELISFLGADMLHPSLKARLEGFQIAVSAAGLEISPPCIIVSDSGEPDYETGFDLSQRLFACEPMPSAVFCANDALALGVLDQAAKRGIRVPEDLAVVGFDDVPRAEHNRPSLTTVRVYKEQMGELAMRYLHERMADYPANYINFERGSHTVRVPTELVIRASS